MPRNLEGAPSLEPLLTGPFGFGVVFVGGPGDLRIDEGTRDHVLTHVGLGLSCFPHWRALAGITWATLAYDVVLDEVPSRWDCGDQPEPCESFWRDPALARLGVADVGALAAKIAADTSTPSARVLFVTRYPIKNFAYAYRGGSYTVMAPDLHGAWDEDDFFRVFAHEVGHLFAAPDEYAAAGCDCTTAFGELSVPNGNCETCAPAARPCLMNKNDLVLCHFTRQTYGWSNLIDTSNQVLGPSGGFRGEAFDGPPAPPGTRVTGLRVMTTHVIAGLSWLTGPPGGPSVESPWFGEARDDARTRLVDFGGRQLARIEGRRGGVVDQLTLLFDDGSREHVGGDGGEVDFGYDLPAGYELVGLHGRSGEQIDAIGVVVRPTGSPPPAFRAGAFGGTLGDPFDAPPPGPNARIAAVRVAWGQYVDALGLVWEVDGQIQESPMFGGSGGLTIRIDIAADEALVGVLGWYGDVIDAIQFVIRTRDGRHRYTQAFGGPEGPAPFEFLLGDPQARILGFWGRSAELVDALGVYASG